MKRTSITLAFVIVLNGFHFGPLHAGGPSTAVGRESGAGTRQTVETHKFHLRKVGPDSKAAAFEVNRPGTIKVQAEWEGTENRLLLTLSRYGQRVATEVRSGTSTLNVSHTVDAEAIAQGTRWCAEVSMLGDVGHAEGTIRNQLPGVRALTRRKKARYAPQR